MDFKALSDPVVLVGDTGKKRGFFSKIKPPLTNFSKKQLIGSTLTVLLLFAVGIGVYVSQKPTQLSPRADTSPQPLPSYPAGRDYPVKGDGNSDGRIDLQDLSILYSAWNSGADVAPNSPIDFNDDRKIDSFDYSKLQELLYSLGILKKH